MKRKAAKLISLILTAALIFSCQIFTAFAEELEDPKNPSLISSSEDTITLKAEDNFEYAIQVTKDDGTLDWQWAEPEQYDTEEQNVTFTELTPDTEYTFAQRVKDTDTIEEAHIQTYKTAAAQPPETEPETQSETTPPETEPETQPETTPPETEPETIKAQTPDAPKAVQITDTQITAAPADGADDTMSYEYRLNGGQYQDSPEFKGLTPGTEYKIYIRVKAGTYDGKDYEASDDSAPLAATTKTFLKNFSSAANDPIFPKPAPRKIRLPLTHAEDQTMRHMPATPWHRHFRPSPSACAAFFRTLLR